MHLSFHHAYPGTPDETVNLFKNPDFISDVAAHSGATRHEVTVDDRVTQLALSLPTPSDVARFVGKVVDLALVFRWLEPDASPERSCNLGVDVKGLPVSAEARCILRPTPEGTSGDYSGNLVVRIPIVGSKVERMVVPFLVDAFDGIERRANAWGRSS